MGDISIRDYIRWLPEAASEPTSTIVLTSSERRFVDLRILKTPETWTDAASTDEEVDSLPLSRLDWAIAGTSKSSPRDPVDGHEVSHAEWHHWIDSRTPHTEGAVDEGDNYTQPDGITVLEKGRMVNPATGRETDYEEVWRSEPIQAVPVMIGPGPRGAENGVTVCVVLELEEIEEGKVKKRGMVMRLGQYCQALVREGFVEGGDEKITIERLQWDADKGKWMTQVRIGDAEMPTDFATYFGHEAVVDDEVKVGGDEWKVVEKSVL
ncbi:hypothetical protein B0H63DRAFT_388500 [Podospora didyma]|uniref:Protein HRI1 n=1 Tax=Podospora didyma TaxID=330526 RepID=A0AAE0NZQ5_9PEZI|nr:hypothetical protein B0H63DRAFT_388500 [Podospora didyma]